MKKYLIGIDEVGRGPLAGPVAIGAVFATQEIIDTFSEIKESKQLSRKNRDIWSKRILSEVGDSLKTAVAFINAARIDEIGIVPAINEAIVNAIKELNVDPTECHVLLDGGLHAPEIFKSQETIIKGDESEVIIAMASVIAKVARDDYMISIDRDYPEYGFAKHKGYGTRDHTKLIKSYGLSKEHRATFCKNFI